MKVKPLRRDLFGYLSKRGLVRKFNKQLNLFSNNPRHPSLHTEILEPKVLKIYSFRLNQRYRVIFILIGSDEAEVIDINDHYN